MSIIDDLKPSSTHFNPVTGKPYPLHVANPHTNVDVIHSAVESSAGDSGISTLLYDFVPSDGTSITVEHVDDQTMQSFSMYYTVPHPSGHGVTFPATTQTYDYQYVTVPITNLTVGATVYVGAIFYQTPFPQPLTYTVQETGDNITKDYGEQISFVATETTHYLQLSAMGVHDEFTVYSVSAATIDVRQDLCTPFLRTIKDGTVTDTDLNGQPYTVAGEVRTSCSTGTTSASPRSIEYSHRIEAYTVAAGYKSLSVSFENDGAVSGRYAPAGYSFTHDYFDGGYAMEVMLDGTSYMVWEGQ